MSSGAEAPDRERLTAEIGGLGPLDKEDVDVRFESGDRPWETETVAGANSLLCSFSRELIPPPADRGAVLVELTQKGDEAAPKVAVRLWGQGGQEWARLDQGPGGIIVSYGGDRSVRKFNYRFAAR